MQIRKWVFVLIMGILLPASGFSAVVDRIVAVVNEDIITLSELDSAFEPYLKKIEETYKGPDKSKVLAEGRLNMLNRLIDNRLIEQRAKKAGVFVKDEEVMDTIKGLLRGRSIPLEELIKTLEREGSSLENYQKDMKDQMIRMRLLRREIKTKILVSDEEIGEYYLKHRAEYEGKEAVRVKQILIIVPQDASHKVKAKLKADADVIRKRLKDGDPFDLLAVQFSQGPSAATGGDIGYMEKGAMLPEVDAAVFRLQKGEISDVISSQIGLHIVMVLDKRGAGIKSMDVVRNEIKTKLEEDKMDKKYDEWISELRKKAHIEIKN